MTKQTLDTQAMDLVDLAKLFVSRLTLLQEMSEIDRHNAIKLREMKHRLERLEKKQPAYRDSQLARTIYRQVAYDFKQQFNVRCYDFVMQADEERAIKFWTTWQPNKGLLDKIAELNQSLKEEVIGS